MKIIKDIPLITEIYQYDVILFPVGIGNSMRRGFSREISVNFPSVSKSIGNTPYCDQKKYGTVHCTEINGTIFAGCFIHNGGYNKNNGEYIKYDALKKCIEVIANNFADKKIALGIIGHAPEDGNGDRDKILDIIEETLGDIDYTVYDYLQEDFDLLIYREKCELYRLKSEGKISKDEYTEKMRNVEWKRNHGTLNPMTDDYCVEKKERKYKKIRVTKEMLQKN